MDLYNTPDRDDFKSRGEPNEDVQCTVFDFTESRSGSCREEETFYRVKHRLVLRKISSHLTGVKKPILRPQPDIIMSILSQRDPF